MKTKRADFAAASLRGRMIVAGGLGESVSLSGGLSAPRLPFVLILLRCCDGKPVGTHRSGFQVTYRDYQTVNAVSLS